MSVNETASETQSQQSKENNKLTNMGNSNNNVPTVSDQERELAREASADFLKGDYAKCANTLNKLEVLRPQDLKVTHNKIIVDYYKSNDTKKTEILRKSLNAICNQVSSTSSSSTATTNSINNSNSVISTANSGINTSTVASTKTTLTTMPTLISNQDSEDIERSVIRYNQAVILYHLGQYQAALKLVNNLFVLIEPMEESFVHKVCLLLIELHLALGKPDAALTLVNYIESQFTSTTDSSKCSLGDQNSNSKIEGIVKSAAKISLTPPSGDKEQKKDSLDAASDAFRIKLLKYKLRIYLKTLQLKMCKKEWKTLVSLGMPANISTIFLKANLEYLRKNFKKAMKLLNNISSENCLDFRISGESIPVLYYNNIAAIHFAMGKPNLACYYLKSALDENKKAIESINKDDGAIKSVLPSLHTLGWNKHYELTYGLGVSLLYAGNPVKAFDCFTETAQHFHNNARLWLRMAECCILCHKESNRLDFDINIRRQDICQKVIETNGGVGRKFILSSSLSQSSKYNPQGLSYAIPQPTLEFGMLCLKNAYFILSSSSNEEISILPVAIPVDDPGKKSSFLGSLSSPNSHKLGANLNSDNANNMQQQTTRVPSLSQATVIEHLNMKISILSASAYISLCLGDYIPALEYAKSLLSIKKLPGAHWLLGHLYAAESLIYLDRIHEALEYLKLEHLQDISTYIPIEESIGDKEKMVEEVIEQKQSKVSWYPTNIATAKVILKYNLAVVYAIRGELDKSGEILKQVWISKGPDCDIPVHVIMLALYIELQLGHVEIARTLIKQHIPVQQ